MKTPPNKKNSGQESFLTPIVAGTFHFACQRNAACFTVCCCNLRLILTPYDIIRIKKRLSLGSKEFLDTYTQADFDEEIGLPVVFLKMQDDARRRCPFVSADGCSIYPDRPAACRIYPLGKAPGAEFVTPAAQEHYFLVREPHCLGFKQERVRGINEWLKDQGIDHYNAMNQCWMELITSHTPSRHQGLSEKKLLMFFLASYNLDTFKDFIFSSRFLQLFVIEEKTLAEIKTDEIALLKFACQWLRFSLFGEPTIKVKAEVSQAREKESS